MDTKTLSFSAKKGDVRHLDSFYDVQGVLPSNSWVNCNEEGETFDSCDDDYGLFLKSIDVKVTVNTK